LASQVIVLLAATEGYLDAIALEDVPAFERMLLARFDAEYPTLDQHILRTGELGADVREALIEMIADYGTAWLDGLA
jgi:F0F1-type ATP synthase alpha subunit